MFARAIAIVAAFSIGWVVYMVGVVLNVYDGILSMIVQPFMGALASALCTAVALLVGLLLRIPVVSRWWHSTWSWAALFAGGSLFTLAFGYFLGLTYVGTNPETGKQVLMLHPIAALTGYFFLIFAVANWPMQRRTRQGDQPYNEPLERTGSAGRSTPGR